MSRTEKEIHRIEEIYEDIFENQLNQYMDQISKSQIDTFNAFEMAKIIEDRFDYIITKAKEKADNEISLVKDYNKSFAEKLISQRKSLIDNYMFNFQNDINKSIEEHNQICDKQIEKIRNKYKSNKDKLLKKFIECLGLEFL